MSPTAPDPLLQQMDDIAGLRPVDWWPLAPGWWLVIGLTLVALAALIVLAVRRHRRRQSWQAEAAAELRRLSDGLIPDTVGATAASLSELLRRMALRRYPRADCAALTGTPWLDWLTAHDPRGFDWRTNGAILADAAYAPPRAFTDPAPLRPLLAAAQAWVRARA